MKETLQCSSNLITKNDYITYINNNKDKILGEAIVVNHFIITIDEVLLVIGIEYNLLSISQLSDKGYSIIFLYIELLN